MESTCRSNQLWRQTNQLVRIITDYSSERNNFNISCKFFTVSSLVRKLKQQAREQMEERRPNLVATLRQMGDFYMELKWDFQSWGI